MDHQVLHHHGFVVMGESSESWTRSKQNLLVHRKQPLQNNADAKNESNYCSEPDQDCVVRGPSNQGEPAFTDEEEEPEQPSEQLREVLREIPLLPQPQEEEQPSEDPVRDRLNTWLEETVARPAHEACVKDCETAGARCQFMCFLAGTYFIGSPARI